MSLTHEQIDEDIRILPESEWQAEMANYHQSLTKIVSAHRKRAKSGKKHPVIDFLFEYYHFKPSKLLQWSPGINVTLSGDKARAFLANKAFKQTDLGIEVNTGSFPKQRQIGLNWIIQLLEATLNRPANFGCFGLHEWCMIYEQSDIRHPQLSLRLKHQEIRDIVERHSTQCTHYDAFRFFSASAREFNRVTLTRNAMPANEQPGCLHTNMDLYRWAYKFHPWIPSRLIADTFLLAVDIRQTDMRASPYDVSSFTQLPAIEIETNQGKSEYVSLQKQYAHRAQILRRELIEKLNGIKCSLNY